MARKKLDKVIQYLIPPSLVLLLTVTIIELFYGVGRYTILIDIFDIYVVAIFAVDLYFRWKELPKFIPFVKKYFLDIIATVPFNLIFLGIEGLALIRALRGVRIIARVARAARFARFGKLVRLIRFGARAPRFLRVRKHVKKAKIRKVQPHEKQMKGVLSFRVILLITINSIMGTGIWFLVAAGAKHAGPASLIAWGVLSLIAIYIAMCFGELTSMFPKAGGVYEFAKQTYGRFWSFVIGWTTAIAGSVTIAMLLLGALRYLIPLEYGRFYVPIAIVLIVAFNYIAFRGMNTSTVMLVTFALITLGTVTAIIIPGFIRLDPQNFLPFFVFPTLNILLAIFFISETFFGWESAIFLSAETKNPTKVMPKALIYGTIVIALLSFFLAFTSIGAIPWETFGESAAPLKDLGAFHFGSTGKIIFAVLVFVSIIGAVASWIVTAPRLLMAIAEDKLFFVQFARIHPKHKSPYVSIIFQVFLVSILVIVGAGNYERLLHILIPLILFIYSAVLLSVVVLRFKKPEQKRPYKVIFGKVGPLFTILFMMFLLAMFIRETHGALDILRISASLIIFGIPAYFAIELFYDPKYVRLRRGLMATLKHHYHELPLPKPLFTHILGLVGPITKTSVIVDYESGVGAFTKSILKSGKAFKRISIFNPSKAEIKHVHLPKEHKKQVKVYLRRTWKIPKEIKNVDIFVSFHSLGYIKDIPLFLKELRRMLKKKGKFLFYLRYYGVTPNALLMEDKKKITQLFSREKLRVRYKRKRGLRPAIFMYGYKR